MLRPSAQHIKKHGGLHVFMHWNKPMFTDSGGYQVFAMGHGSVSEEIKKGRNRTLPKSIVSIKEEGVVFKSYVDGSKHLLSPESSIKIQRKLGADIIMQFDECTPFHVDKAYTAESMRRSLRWGKRCTDELKRKENDMQAMYGIVQGGVYPQLRKESIECVEKQDFFGTAIGGSLGSNKSQMYDVVSHATNALSVLERPVHLLGIGDIPDIFKGVLMGVDTFDCVHPTRIARHAHAIVPAAVHSTRHINIHRHEYLHNDSPIDSACPLPCCKRYSVGYIRYLFKAKELLGLYLLSVHNIGQMVRVMREIRNVFIKNDFAEFLALQKFWVGEDLEK